MNKVLIVDDSAVIRRSHRIALEDHSLQCLEAENGFVALEVLFEKYSEISTIIIDQEMPEMNGFELLKRVKDDKTLRHIPIIFVSSIDNRQFIKSLLTLGIYDYLTKPIDKDVLSLKVRNAIDVHHRELYLKELNKYISHKNIELEKTVLERTKNLNEMLNALLIALENANYYNDNDTGNHIHRVASYSELIATKYGLNSSLVSQIKLFASLHDIGKVGVSDVIIKKPGKLTTEEFEEIKTHVTIGYNMIKDAPIPYIAKNIIKYHHEKWNGKGYSEGLAGEDIPIEARIVAISDVFDALISKRVYKEAYSIEKVISILKEERGESFQEELVDIVLENIYEMLEISIRLK